MADYLLKKIDFAYYSRLLHRMTPACRIMAFTNKSGEMCWCGDSSEEMASLLEKARREYGFPGSFSADNGGCVKINDQACLWMRRVMQGETVIGWLVMMAGTEETDGLKDIVPDLLAEICIGVASDYAMIHDLDSVVEEVSLRYEELNFIYGMRDLVRNNRHGNEIFRQTIKMCISTLNIDMAVFFYPDKGIQFQEKKSEILFHGQDLLLSKIRNEVYRFIASSKAPLVINKDDDPRREYLWTNVPYKIMAAPIIVDRKVRATLNMLRTEDRPDFSNSDRNICEAVSEQTAIILLNRIMYGELEVFSEEMASTLIEAIDAKDPYTRGHSDRVNIYAVEMGKALNMGEKELKNLYWASLLHDLGKIGVPDRVLGKTGKLNDDEYTLIKAHPQRSYDIMKDVAFLRPCLDGILHHHERYDGRGYPDELAGTNIPFHARIIAVADTFDAITSSRAYRSARTDAQALAEMQRVRGSQLDPEMVDLWGSVYESQFSSRVKSEPERENND